MRGDLDFISSNKREVLDSIPLSERASSIKYLNLDLECIPVERVLGIKWCADSDNLLFFIPPTEPLVSCINIGLYVLFVHYKFSVGTQYC